jgi:hypothetical protein
VEDTAIETLVLQSVKGITLNFLLLFALQQHLLSVPACIGVQS